MQYKSWHDRIVDHLVRTNVHWGDLLKFVEAEHTPLNWTKLGISSQLITPQTYGVDGGSNLGL